MLQAIVAILEAILSAVFPALLDRLDRPDTAEDAPVTRELEETRRRLIDEVQDFEGI